MNAGVIVSSIALVLIVIYLSMPQTQAPATIKAIGGAGTDAIKALTPSSAIYGNG